MSRVSRVFGRKVNVKPAALASLDPSNRENVDGATLKSLCTLINDAWSMKDIGRAMNRVSDTFRMFGIESITDDDGDPVLLYVNAGDVYTTTLVYDVQDARWFVTDYGSWVEWATASGRLSSDC